MLLLFASTILVFLWAVQWHRDELTAVFVKLPCTC
jgi:hypothetical protein